LCYFGPGFILGVRVVMVVVVTMVMAGGERWSGKHHQKQGSCKDLFHGTNVARRAGRGKVIHHGASRELRGRSTG
jgi:hypothetical protein